jgi:excisionase family DNA binding protein
MDPEAVTFISTAEAAERWGIPLRTLQRYCNTGKIAAVRVGRDWLVQEQQIVKREEKPE